VHGTSCCITNGGDGGVNAKEPCLLTERRIVANVVNATKKCGRTDAKRRGGVEGWVIDDHRGVDFISGSASLRCMQSSMLKLASGVFSGDRVDQLESGRWSCGY